LGAPAAPPHARRLLTAAAAAVFALSATPAHAGGGPSLPINQMLQNVLSWLSGPLAITVGTIALVAAAFVWMFLRHERGADFAFRALLGTSIAIGAAAIINLLVGAGALL
jgi:type IV secretory pathway VirB2 component (pilin)